MMKNSKKIVAVFLSCAMAVTSFLPANAQEMANVEATVSEEQTADGTLESGWYGSIQEGSLSYVSESGSRVIGLHEIDGQLYYFDEAGIVKTGWMEIEGNLYYFVPETGQAYRDTVKTIDGVEYEFSLEGIASEMSTEESDTSDDIQETVDETGTEENVEFDTEDKEENLQIDAGDEQLSGDDDSDMAVDDTEE